MIVSEYTLRDSISATAVIGGVGWAMFTWREAGFAARLKEMDTGLPRRAIPERTGKGEGTFHYHVTCSWRKKFAKMRLFLQRGHGISAPMVVSGTRTFCSCWVGYLGRGKKTQDLDHK